MTEKGMGHNHVNVNNTHLYDVKGTKNSGSIPRNACVCLGNIAMCDYQESVTSEQTDAGQSDPYVPLCFEGGTKNRRSIPRNPYVSLAPMFRTQK